MGPCDDTGVRFVVVLLFAIASTRLAAAQDPGEPATEPAPEPPPAEDLSDEDLAKLAEGEAIEIFAERPDKPFDRDTEVRLTGEELAARGAVDLASALALLPDVTIREAGRAGKQIDIRGGRKGEVTILIDGVSVSDPYYGNFDVTTIPITDIVQIRVSTTPQSPIDGPGGSGGVIEVHTRDAIGPQLVIGRVLGDTMPTFGITSTARVALAKRLALRVSTSNTVGSRELAFPMDQTLGDGRRAASGAARLEYRNGDRRLALDAFLDDRSYIQPPTEDDSAVLVVTMIDRETSFRTTGKLDDKVGTLQLQAQGWFHSLDRRTRSFRDITLTDNYYTEDISALRYGGMALATKPFRKAFRWTVSGTVTRESARVVTDMRSIGDVTIAHGAAALGYERKQLRVEAAAGLAVPFGIDADPWPEAKLVTKYKPRPHLELTATGGYKGRLPTLRERFDAMSGDPTLDPEHAAHAELRAVEHVEDRVHVEVAPFYRHSTGIINRRQGNVFRNTGPLDIYGIDVIARAFVHPRVELAASYQFIRARGENNPEPLDFLPHHKADAWARVALPRKISALARARYISTAIDAGMEVGNYTLVEANVTAELGSEYMAVLRVDDLFDLRPDVRAGYPGPGRVITLVLQGAWQ